MGNSSFLSKSKYLHGRQCSKLLWYEYHRKSDIPSPEPAIQFAFDEGHRVGDLAQKLFPGGLTVPRDWEPLKQHEKSLSLLAKRLPLFEAGFVFGQAYALADILAPVDDDAWDLIEVKSGTSVKEEHYHDVAFQRYVYEGAGVKIRHCYIYYVNKEYVRRGEIIPEQFFAKRDITMETQVLAGQVPKALEAVLKVVDSSEMPEIKVGPHCDSPHHCPLSDICWQVLPSEDDIFSLHSGGSKSWELWDAGVNRLTDIPENYELNYRQIIQVAAHKSGQPYIDRQLIKEFLAQLRYPLFFLDFETISTAIPLYEGLSPYQPVPFQYVVYRQESETAKPEHFSFLSPDGDDPRLRVLAQLKELFGEEGSVIAYSAQFEKSRLKTAAQAFPEYREWVERLLDRFVDLLEPFQKFYYYHPAQKGRASLKNVLPALTGRGYGSLEIAEGGSAAAEFYRTTFGNVSQEERQKVRLALEIYCDQDTHGMVEILNFLRGL